MRQNKLILIFTSFLIVLVLLGFKYTNAQTSNSPVLGSDDAIGVRIIPNPNHYSIQRWYESQGFRGAPQALIVDGYEAIRDGRTVYVNAANIDQQTNPKKIYTNIYLISYNQNPTTKTVDILGQIVSHWKFNSNIEEAINPEPSCAISSLPCINDQDCGKEQVCGTSTLITNQGSLVGYCVLKTTANCLTDEDCPNNFFCNSVKAKISRDIKRVGKLEELKEALFTFKKSNNHYPLLDAGSYLTNHTVSVWPSWTQEFLSALAVTQNFVDPINRLGVCLNYDKKTCWNKETKQFVYPPSPTFLKLPTESFAFVYKTDTNGSNYSLCAVMESRNASLGLNYEFEPKNPNSSECVTATGIITGGTATNTAPILIEKSLNGEAGLEFNGFLKVIDQESNPLTWTFNTSWSQAPVLQETNDPNQKRVYAVNAGAPGVYGATLIVNDGQGGILSTSTPIKIINPVPFIEADDAEYILDPIIPFDYSFYFSDNNISSPSANVAWVSGPNILSGLNQTITSVGINKYRVRYSGKISGSQFFQDTQAVYKATVTDAYGASASKQFTIRLLVTSPQLTFNCPTSARLGQNYSCLLGSASQGNHTLTYSSNVLPAGLKLATTTAIAKNKETGFPFSERIKKLTNSFYSFLVKAAAAVAPPGSIVDLKTYLNGVPTATSTGYKIAIKATNEYGASSTREFILKIGSYCGDGVKQLPNLEGRGGFYNDGYEDCDGSDGVTNDPEKSSPDLQYACATGVGASTPNPIPNNNYCIFTSPDEGGGYCGDGICVPLEEIGNCQIDCAHACNPNFNCAGKECGPSGCGVSCGECLEGETCNSSGQCVADCAPDCTGKECGSDGCFSTCGTCTNGEICKLNQCVPSGICVPDCQGRTCGLDPVCGTLSCGTCSLPKVCKTNIGVCCNADCNGCIGAVSSSSQQPCGQECCNVNTEVCCNNTCKPKTGWQKCGNNCCNLSISEYCCPNTHACVPSQWQCLGH